MSLVFRHPQTLGLIHVGLRANVGVLYFLSIHSKQSFRSWYVPDVLPSDVAVSVCAYLGCHSHMFELQLFDVRFNSLQFLPALILILSPSAAESAFHSISLFQDVSENFLPTERQAGTCTLTVCVCVCVCLCVFGCCFRYASAVIPCVWCARRGRHQWCVNKSSIFNLSSQVELPSATAGSRTHIHTQKRNCSQTRE